MARKEIENSKAYQVSKEALKYYNEHYKDKDIDLMDAFEAGAEWDEEVMIDKACDWLENNKHLYKVLSFGSLSTDWDKFIREFRKAMKS